MPKHLLKFILLVGLVWMHLPAGAQSKSQSATQLSLQWGETKEELISQLSSATSDTTRVQILTRLCATLNWSDPDTTLLLAKQAFELAEKNNDNYSRALAYQALCRVHTVFGRYPLATEYGLLSLSIFNAHDRALDAMSVKGDIALCYREQGDGVKALKYLLEARNTAIKHNRALFGVNGMLSSVYDLINEPDSTLKYAREAQAANPDWSALPYYIGRAFEKKNMPDSALAQYVYGLKLADEQHVLIDVIDYHNAIAEILIQNNDRDSAIALLKSSISIGSTGIYPKGIMKSASLLGKLYNDTNKPDSALKYLNMRIVLQDSLFNREKIVAVQALDFKEQQKNILLQQKEKDYQNKLMIAGLGGGLVLALVILFAVGKNNRTRRRNFELLEAKNQEIEKQKNVAEKALSDLKAAQVQLVHAEKMASLGELTAGIAHEIQNPLNFVNNFSQLNSELAAEGREAISSRNWGDAEDVLGTIAENNEKILQHGKRADAIVKSMLEHSRASAGVKEPTDINKLADKYLRLAYHGMRARDNSFNCHINFAPDPGLGKIDVVPQDIGRVLLNLFNNALYAVDEKKKQQGDGYEPGITVSTFKSNDKVEISVKDNGNGIPKKILEKIFQPFFTTKPTGEGTGLGLSLAYDIIKAHGGEIRVESKEGEGSGFTIFLPINT